MSTSNTINGDKRVVSFFIWDPELERKIDCEVKMIDGISKLLNVVTTIEQTIECNKALILSQQRMLAFMAEIKRKQQNLLQRDGTNLEPTKATVSLSDIRLPLKWSNMKKAKTDQKKFAVFCLARIGYEIIDTQMKFIDKQSTEVLFTDQLIFENVPQNFQLHLEVYALNKSLAVSTAAKDFAERYSYFSTYGSPRFRRKTPDKNSTQQQQQSKFVLIARATYTKGNVHKMPKIRSLIMERLQENPLMQLPIENTFTSRFIIQPLCYTRSATFAGIAESNNRSYSCILSKGFLNGEEIMRNDYLEPKTFSIPITPDTLILSRNDHLSFSIYNRGFNQEDFFVQDLFTLNLWIQALQQHIVDIRAWQMTVEHLPSMRRYSYQPVITSITSTPLTKKPTLRTKARSLDNLYQTGTSSQLITTNKFISSKKIHYSSDEYSTDDDDDDNVSVLHTKL